MILTRYVLKNRVLYSPSTLFRTGNYYCCFQRVVCNLPLTQVQCDNVVSRPLVIPRWMSSSSSEEKPLTPVQKLKTAVKDYGSTVIVFHVTISLISLGCFYLAVCSGLDVVGLLQNLGINISERMTAVVEGAGTFAIAYAIHKVFAPVRISITLGTTPFIVRYLRKVGFLKSPKT